MGLDFRAKDVQLSSVALLARFILPVRRSRYGDTWMRWRIRIWEGENRGKGLRNGGCLIVMEHESNVIHGCEGGRFEAGVQMLRCLVFRRLSVVDDWENAKRCSNLGSFIGSYQSAIYCEYVKKCTW